MTDEIRTPAPSPATHTITAATPLGEGWVLSLDNAGGTCFLPSRKGVQPHAGDRLRLYREGQTIQRMDLNGREVFTWVPGGEQSADHLALSYEHSALSLSQDDDPPVPPAGRDEWQITISIRNRRGETLQRVNLEGIPQDHSAATFADLRAIFHLVPCKKLLPSLLKAARHQKKLLYFADIARLLAHFAQLHPEAHFEVEQWHGQPLIGEEGTP